MIEGEGNQLHSLTGIGVLRLALFTGMRARTWWEWQSRGGQETRHKGPIPQDHWVTPEETAAILKYRESRMERGYWVLCRQMVDADRGAVSPATMYNMLKRGGLTKQWVEL